MSTDTLERPVSPADIWNGPVIDCDVHAFVPSHDALFKYMDRVWVEAARERGWKGPNVSDVYPPQAPTTVRAAWRPKDRPAASDLSLLQQQLLDPGSVEYAILNCYYGLERLHHPDWSAALARAVNDWLIAEWLEKDPRLRASIAVPADPGAAAVEISRVGSHPGFVQVLLPIRTYSLYGKRSYWPLFEAIEANDLVAGLHWGGRTWGAPSPTGYANYFAEEMAAEVQVFTSQLTSMVAEGLFQKFPKLRVAVLEGGFTWFPTMSWAINKKWKGLRREIPWVDRLPSEIMRQHLRLSVAPADLGPLPHVAHVLDWLKSDDMLMYASDYPHMHHDELADLLSVCPDITKANIMSETARRWYRL